MLKKYFKIFFGICLFSFLVIRFDYSSIIETIKSSDISYIAIGFTLFFISGVFEVCKFLALLSRKFTFLEALKIVYSGLFLNNFVPTNIGGDAYRILKVAKRSNYKTSSIIVLMDRLNGLILILLLSLFALHLRPVDLSEFGVSSVENIWVVSALLVLFLFVSFVIVTSKHTQKILGDIRLISMSGYLFSVIHSMLFHIFRIVGIYYFILAVGSDINIFDISVVLALVLLISVIPISIGALGVREAAFVAGFSIYSIDPVSGLAVAILTRFFLFFQAAVGYFTFSLGKK